MTEEIALLEHRMKTSFQQEVQEMQRKLTWMKETEMAVVISQEQNEIQTFKKWELNIFPHREKMEKRELDVEYKKTNPRLRVVFVCAMWLTGFDVKSLSLSLSGQTNESPYVDADDCQGKSCG